MNILELNKKLKKLVFIPQTIEDLWVLKNISFEKDLISGKSYRRQKQEDTNNSERKPVFVCLEINKIEYSSFLNSLRFTGIINNSSPSDLAPKGEFHTLEIKLNEKYSLEKKNFFDHEINLIKNSSKITNKINLVVIDDEFAEIFELTDIGVKSISKIASGKSGKRFSEKSDYSFSFFEEVYNCLSKNNPIIIAGPGHYKSRFSKFLKSKSSLLRISEVSLQNTSKSSINELFTKKEVSLFFKDSIIFKEKEMIEKFKEELGKSSNKAIYGYNDINKYMTLGIIDFILISESFWRKNIDSIQNLIIDADKTKTKVHVVDLSHEDISKTLNSFSGIIGVLKFKVF
ncbi:MAG: hypothetical protein PHR26_00670 [Candidatus ainarchaeum sp.]|nr:hypothetical protein [Candidatus ainarchaeum sp.]MDD3976253.1 hypothetical protein [Candidatus ainarchaeum sp.]